MAPTSSTPPSSNKLLMTDLNPKFKPKPCLNTAPPNSTSSSSTAAAPLPEKKTRDQPNFSDCHCCGGRINNTNPKDRLQPLDSVWRIVLLCRGCRRNVRSGQTCPYCFRGTGNSGDFLICSVCERKIHRDCVRNYGNCTPWCYLGVGSEGLRVCVDCWVPELLKNSIRVSGRSENKGGLKENVGKSKAMVDMDSPNAENLNFGDSTEVVDDAELAIKLHRSMNSSPRITRIKPLLKTPSDSDISNIRDWNGLSYMRSRFGTNHAEDKDEEDIGVNCTNIDSTGLNIGVQCYKRDKTRKIWQLIEGVATKTRSSIHSHLANVDGAQEILSYQRRFKRKLFQVNRPVGGSEESSSLDNRGVASLPECSRLDDAEAILDRYHLKYEKRHAGTKPKLGFLHFIPHSSQDNSEVGFDIDGPRYHLKYAKRGTCTKRESSFVHYTALLRENQASAPVLNDYAVCVESDGKLNFQIGTVNPDLDRYCYKYTKRVKSSKSCSIPVLKGIDASAAGLTTNCSGESRTLSNVTFDSFTVGPSK